MIEPHDGIIGIGSGGTYALGASWLSITLLRVYERESRTSDCLAPLFVRFSTADTAAARALIDQPNLDAEEIGRRSMQIAADICVYTNHNFVVEVLEENPEKKD